MAFLIHNKFPCSIFINFWYQKRFFIIGNIRDRRRARRCPTVLSATPWITLGYYKKKDKFKIDTALEDIFKQYSKLDKDFSFPMNKINTEISATSTKYISFPDFLSKSNLFV